MEPVRWHYIFILFLEIKWGFNFFHSVKNNLLHFLAFISWKWSKCVFIDLFIYFCMYVNNNLVWALMGGFSSRALAAAASSHSHLFTDRRPVSNPFIDLAPTWSLVSAMASATSRKYHLFIGEMWSHIRKRSNSLCF